MHVHALQKEMSTNTLKYFYFTKNDTCVAVSSPHVLHSVRSHWGESCSKGLSLPTEPPPRLLALPKADLSHSMSHDLWHFSRSPFLYWWQTAHLLLPFLATHLSLVLNLLLALKMPLRIITILPLSLKGARLSSTFRKNTVGFTL